MMAVFLSTSLAFSKDYKKQDESVVFAGRISRINSLAKLLRLKIDFENAKFLSKNNRIEILAKKDLNAGIWMNFTDVVNIEIEINMFQIGRKH